MDTAVVIVVLVLALALGLSGAWMWSARRRGWTPFEGRGRLQLLVVALLGLGALAWLSIARDEQTDMSWTWVMSVVLATLMPLALAQPRLTTRLLWALMVAGPVMAVLGMVSLYVFGAGVSDGAGGTESLPTMLLVAVAGSAFFVAGPAAASAFLLRASAPPPMPPLPPDTPAAWYADPRRKFRQRYWDGTQWTAHVAAGGKVSADLP